MNVMLTCLLLYFYCKFYTAEVAVYFYYLTAGHKFQNEMLKEILSQSFTQTFSQL